MGKYDNNPIIQARYDAYGIKTYWAQGYYGQGIKVAVVDEFGIEHGHQMASKREYIAPKCELIRADMPSNSCQAMADGIDYAVAQGADIISISRGSEERPYLKYAVERAEKAGAIIVCSAGNDGDKFGDYVDIKQYPAAYTETISVLSVDNSLMPSKFSSHGSTGTVTGWGLNSLVKGSDGAETLVSGTSPTTADIAFTLALWLCMMRDKGSNPTPEEIRKFVCTSTVDLNEPGRDNMTGYGFFTLDRDEYKRIKLMMFDSNKDGIEDRVNLVKEYMEKGMSYEEAERRASAGFYVIGYEMLNGVRTPVYGGRKAI